MYEDFSPAQKPTPDATIWRYMDFTKFVSMLDTQSLYFTRVNELADPFEGVPTKLGCDMDVPPELAEDAEGRAMIEQFNCQYRLDAKAIRYHFYVNCWHINNHESAAMWSLYLKSNEGVAIRSTFNRLCESVEAAEETVRAGKIAYLDYDKQSMPWGNMAQPCMHKRISYAHEQELRAFYWMWPLFSQEILQGKEGFQPDTPPGVSIKTDLHKLIGQVYVAPTCPEWFRNLVKRVMERYECRAPVVKSSLADSPIW